MLSINFKNCRFQAALFLKILCLNTAETQLEERLDGEL